MFVIINKTIFFVLVSLAAHTSQAAGVESIFISSQLDPNSIIITEIDIIFVPQGFDSAMASLPARRREALKVYLFGQHDSSSMAPIDVTEIQKVLVEIDQFGIGVSIRR